MKYTNVDFYGAFLSFLEFDSTNILPNIIFCGLQTKESHFLFGTTWGWVNDIHNDWYILWKPVLSSFASHANLKVFRMFRYFYTNKAKYSLGIWFVCSAGDTEEKEQLFCCWCIKILVMDQALHPQSFRINMPWCK